MQNSTPSDIILCRIDDRGAQGCVAYITANNPKKHNAMGVHGKRAIADTFNRLARDDKDERLRVAVITGAGDKSFFAGADLEEAKDLNAEQAELEHIMTHMANDSIRMFPVPVIARINGWCLGLGPELASSCDMRIGADTAKIGMPEVRVGLPSGMEACLLPGLVGWGKAAELIYTGDVIDAQEAYRCGFLQKVVPVAELDAAVEKMVSSILLGGPRAIRLQKALMRDWQRMSIGDSVWQGIRSCVAARDTDEPKRLMEAFLARKKRK